MATTHGSVGVVKTKIFSFNELRLESGEKINNVNLAYETYGKLNKKKSNAILICHALSGDQHAAGKHRKNSRQNGWYEIAIGPGKTFDTNKYFIICSNILGGCKGSTGPSSINPKTKKPYGLDFPLISVGDMVEAQKKLVDHFGINKLFCITGGSLGGMQVLKWIVKYPDFVHVAIPIATAAKQYPMNIAFHEIGRQAILNDPNFRDGKYYDTNYKPQNGLSVARQIGHVTYLSQDTLDRKFNRNKKPKPPKSKFGVEFEIQSYLRYKGGSFVRRFDANSYLYITNAIDQFDLTEGETKKLSSIFSNVKTKVLLISISSDLLYPPEHVEEIYGGLAEAGVPTVYKKLDLPYGHDTFLIFNNTLGNVLIDFLKTEEEKYFIDG